MLVTRAGGGAGEFEGEEEGLMTVGRALKAVER